MLFALSTLGWGSVAVVIVLLLILGICWRACADGGEADEHLEAVMALEAERNPDFAHRLESAREHNRFSNRA